MPLPLRHTHTTWFARFICTSASTGLSYHNALDAESLPPRRRLSITANGEKGPGGVDNSLPPQRRRPRTQLRRRTVAPKAACIEKRDFGRRSPQPQSTSRQVMPASVPCNRSPWAPTGVGPFPCNQLAMRSKNDAERHERCHLAQYGLSEPLAEDGRRRRSPSFNCSRRAPNCALARDSLREETRSHRVARSPSHPNNAASSICNGTTP